MTVLVVVAHYDDETIGASRLLAQQRWPVEVLHVTDSAPLNLTYARRAGFATREEYARARRREMLAAMKLAGVPARRCQVLGIADQDAPRRVKEMAMAIARRVRNGRWRVFTHAYEGGHPDHDACALATHLAVQDLWARDSGPREPAQVELFEMPFYHAAKSAMVAAEFIDGEASAARPLSTRATARRQAMFRCFASQAHVFERFPKDLEPYRPAPRYDFSRPPHEGKLYYETRPLGWTWAAWRRATSKATR